MTLNIATDKATGWRYFRDSTNPNALTKREISPNHMIENAKSFAHLMNNSLIDNKYSKFMNSTSEFSFFFFFFCMRRACSLGWLPAMTHLSQILLNGEIRMENVRIGMNCSLCELLNEIFSNMLFLLVVRYEYFSKPIAICVNLFRFIYGPKRMKMVDDQIRKVCFSCAPFSFLVYSFILPDV